MIVTCLTPISLGGVNYLFPSNNPCCNTIRCSISLTPGESFREVHRIKLLNDTCGSYIESVNGIPYVDPLAYHYTITDDPDTNIEIVMKICGSVGSCNPNLFDLQIICQNPNFTETFNYVFDYLDFTFTPNFPFPQVISGGIFAWLCRGVNCTEVKGDPIEVVNNSVTELEVSITPGGTGINAADWTFYLNGDLSTPYLCTGTTAVIPVPPNSTSFITYAVCPSPGAGFGGIDLSICDLTWTLPFSYNILNCESCAISCVDVSLLTENAYLPSSAGYCNPLSSNLYTTAAIGEKKILRFELVYDLGFTGTDIDIYFNPWLYDVVCNIPSKYGSGIIDGPPPSGWHFKFQPIYVGSGPQQMTLFGAGINANVQKNISAEIQFFITPPGDPKLFTIELSFFLIEDLDNWIDTGVIANQFKLLNSHVLAPNPFENIVQSVYNADKRICGLVYIVDPSNPVEEPGTGNPNVVPPIPPNFVPYECALVKTIPITARYYNRGLYDGPSEFTNPSFNFFRNSVSVPNFSTLLKTEISFRITSNPGGSGISNVLFWLIDGSKTDNYDTFLGNYDASRGEITTAGGFGIIDNHLQNPSQGPTGIGGGVYETKCFVDTNLDPNGIYYVIAVVYNSTDSIVNSFISDPILVTEIPGIEICCPLSIDSMWADYIRSGTQYSELCFTPTMKERIVNQLSVNEGDFGICLRDYGYTGSYLDVLKSIRLNIYRKEIDFPSPGTTTFFNYESLTSIRTPGFPANWNNTSPGYSVADNGTSITIFWEGRVRYEDTLSLPGGNVFIASNSTPNNRTPAGGLGSVYVNTLGVTYDWANLDIFFEYVFEFDLSPIFGLPCTVNQVRINTIKPIDFEPNTLPFPSLFKPLRVIGWKDGDDTTITGPFCDGTYDYLEIVVEAIGTYRGFLLAFLDPFPYGINGLIEDDGTLPSPSGFVQLDAIPIYDVDPYFNSTGTFKIDLSLIPPGKYQICGLVLDDPNN